MRIWQMAAAAALLALVLVPALWTPIRASNGDADPSRFLTNQEDDSDLATRVAALETEVAALQTSVAGLQSTDADPTAQPTEADPTPVALVTPACGQPFASWGAATSDNIRIQLLQVQHGAEADVAIEGSDVYLIELALDNRGNENLTLNLTDFTILDCDDQAYAAVAGGFEPSIAPGEIAPGDSARGWLTFAVAPGTQPATFVYGIQSPNRTGAQVSCPLVNRDAPPGTLDDASGGAGCSARGGSG